MYEITLLGLSECRAALNAMLQSPPAKAKGRIAMAIVNDYGELMLFVRMDGTAPAVCDFAVKKAYTSARMRSDLGDFRAGLEQRGRTVADYSDPGLVGMAAGGVIVAGSAAGAVLGAIGVSGGTPAEDDEIARIGLAALRAQIGGDHA